MFKRQQQVVKKYNSNLPTKKTIEIVPLRVFTEISKPDYFPREHIKFLPTEKIIMRKL